MSGIASEIIKAIAGIGTTLISGGLQSKALSEGEEASEAQYASEMALKNRELAQQATLTREQLREQRREFQESLELQKETLAMQQEQNARTSFRDQVTNLTSVLEKNENLKNIYLNRLKGLRGGTTTTTTTTT